MGLADMTEDVRDTLLKRKLEARKVYLRYL